MEKAKKKKIIIIAIAAVVVVAAIAVTLGVILTLTSDKAKLVGTWERKREWHDSSTTTYTYEFRKSGFGDHKSVSLKDNNLDVSTSRFSWEIQGDKLIINYNEGSTYIYEYIQTEDRLILDDGGGESWSKSTYIKKD